MRAHIRLAYLEGLFGVLIGLTTALGTGIVLFVGVKDVQAGTLTLGGLLLIMAYLLQIYVPLKALSHGLITIQQSLAGAERSFAILDEEPDVPELPHAHRLHRAEGRIAFRKVMFGYGRGPQILHNVTFEDVGEYSGILPDLAGFETARDSVEVIAEKIAAAVLA